MKKLVFILSIVFLVLQSCSSGDSNSEQNNTDNSLLIRKWYAFSYTDQGVIKYIKPCSNGNRDYLEFVLPNIANYYHYKSDCSYAIESYTWTKSGNIIKLNFYGSISTLTISELSATSLIYVKSESGPDAISSSLNVFHSY